MKHTNAIDRLKKAGLKRSEIASACNVSRAAVSHWATGRSIPKAEQMAELVRLATDRGVVLLASDFVSAGRTADPAPAAD